MADDLNCDCWKSISNMVGGLGNMSLFEEFKRQFPYMVDHVSKIKNHRDGTIDIFYEDGSFGVFDNVIGTFRYFPKCRDMEMTENRWKIELGQKIYRTMLSKGYTMRQLADISKLGYDTLSRYINGHTAPTSYTLKRIATALGVSVGELTSFEKYYK